MNRGPEKDLNWVRDIIIRQHAGDTIEGPELSAQEAKEALQILIQLAEQDEKRLIEFLQGPLLPEQEKQKYIYKPDPANSRKRVEYFDDGDIVGQRFHRFRGVADEELRQLNEKLNLDILNANIVTKLNEKYNLLTGKGQYVEIKKTLDGLFGAAQTASSETQFRNAHANILAKIEQYVDEGHQADIINWLREDDAFRDLNDPNMMGKPYTLEQNIIERLKALDPENFNYRAKVTVKQNDVEPVLPPRQPLLDVVFSGVRINLIATIESAEEVLSEENVNLSSLRIYHYLLKSYIDELDERCTLQQKREFMNEDKHGQRIKAINKAVIQLTQQAKQQVAPQKPPTQNIDQQPTQKSTQTLISQIREDQTKHNQLANIDSMIEALEFAIQNKQDASQLKKEFYHELKAFLTSLNDNEKRAVIKDDNRGQRIKAINKAVIQFSQQAEQQAPPLKTPAHNVEKPSSLKQTQEVMRQLKQDDAINTKLASIDSMMEALEFAIKNKQDVSQLKREFDKELEALLTPLNDNEKRAVMNDDNRGKKIKAINRAVIQLTKQAEQAEQQSPQTLKDMPKSKSNDNTAEISEMFNKLVENLSDYDRGANRPKRSKAKSAIVTAVKQIGRINPITQKGKKRDIQKEHLINSLNFLSSSDELLDDKTKLEDACAQFEHIRDEIRREHNVVPSNLEKLCDDSIKELHQLSEKLGITIEQDNVNQFKADNNQPDRKNKKNL